MQILKVILIYCVIVGFIQYQYTQNKEVLYKIAPEDVWKKETTYIFIALTLCYIFL